MARTEDDTWDISESVGATALGVAGGRAAETNRADPLISDRYAQLFLEAAGDGIWRLYLDDELPAELIDLDPQFEDRMQAMLGYTACRTKFFDEYFLAAASDGVRQAVILAAGLDSRAWRLAWPAGCGLRDRPAQGAGIQDRHAGISWGRHDRHPRGRGHRSASRLADSVGAGRV